MSITLPDDRVTEYMPTVATTEFAALFPIVNIADIAVEIDGVRRNDFTVTATFTDGISNDAKAVFSPGVTGDVRVIGARAPRRENRFGAGPIPPRDLNKAFDSVEMEMQEASRDIGRSLQVPIGSTGYGVQAGIRDGRVLVMCDGVVSEGIADDWVSISVGEAQASAERAWSEVSRSDSARDASIAAALISNEHAVSATRSSSQSQSFVLAAQAAFIGVKPETIRDLGRVTDEYWTLETDLGRIADLD